MRGRGVEVGEEEKDGREGGGDQTNHTFWLRHCLKVGGRPALSYIRQMNRVNFRSGYIGHDDSTINIVLALLLLLLLL